MKIKIISALFLATTLISIVACKNDDVSPTDYGIFSSQDEKTAIMDGVIGSNTPEHWDNLITAFPEIDMLIIKDGPGSEDDEANLKVSRKIRDKNIRIHLPADAEIASGAVDMFLAGTTRTRETGSKIGVHSWSDGNKEATDFEEGHANHLPYIDYYKEMGFSQSDAEAFYYFTIHAASAENIHWMTDAEVEEYKLLKQ